MKFGPLKLEAVNYKKLHKYVEIAKNIDIGDINPRTRHFAFIINKNKIISQGFNTLKTHPFLLKYGYRSNCKVHAEASAIIKSNTFNHKNNKMITFRFDKSGNLNQGKPCKYCQNILNLVDMKEVWYSDLKGEFKML